MDRGRLADAAPVDKRAVKGLQVLNKNLIVFQSELAVLPGNKRDGKRAIDLWVATQDERIVFDEDFVNILPRTRRLKANAH
jgi:hypothetical protein